MRNEINLFAYMFITSKQQITLLFKKENKILLLKKKWDRKKNRIIW